MLLLENSEYYTKTEWFCGIMKIIRFFFVFLMISFNNGFVPFDFYRDVGYFVDYHTAYVLRYTLCTTTNEVVFRRLWRVIFISKNFFFFQNHFKYEFFLSFIQPFFNLTWRLQNSFIY